MEVWVIVVACLIGAPETRANCVELPIDQSVAGFAACELAGQTAGAEWIHNHPGYRYRRTKCAIGFRPPREDEA